MIEKNSLYWGAGGQVVFCPPKKYMGWV